MLYVANTRLDAMYRSSRTLRASNLDLPLLKIPCSLVDANVHEEDDKDQKEAMMNTTQFIGALGFESLSVDGT